MNETDFLRLVRANASNVALLTRLNALALPQCHLTAGCLFQAVWNDRSGLPADWGVRDYDVFYYDEGDTSWEAEDRIIQQVIEATADLGVTVEVRNQARVHLWYGNRFGGDYPRLQSVRDGINRYLVACTCVGIDVRSGTVYATFGLNELSAGILRNNPVNSQLDLFHKKAESYQARWPWLSIQG